MADEDGGTPGGPPGYTGRHPRAYIARNPNGGYAMKGRGKPSYTFIILICCAIVAAIFFHVAGGL